MNYKPLWSDAVEKVIRKEARSLDEQTIPDHVQMCVRCVQTNQRPRIQFDDSGLCSACGYHDRQENGIDWEERGKQLGFLLDNHRGRTYDVVVPCSAGKDSSYVAVTLKKSDMHPLCATWSPHIYTDIGWKNLQSFIHSGFDVVLAQPNGLLHRKLSRLALEYFGDPFLPFIYGQLCWPFHVAVANGVDLVFYGENAEAIYGGDPSSADKPCWDDADWERVYMKGGSVDKLCALGLELGALSEHEIETTSPFYTLPNVPARPQFHWMSFYRPWRPQQNFYEASETTGFECNPERSPATYSKYASIDDRLDVLHYRLGFCKFGIGRATSDAAHEVRDGELTREEALALVAKYDDEHPMESPHFQECLGYLGLDKDWYDEIESRFRNGKAG